MLQRAPDKGLRVKALERINSNVFLQVLTGTVSQLLWPG